MIRSLVALGVVAVLLGVVAVLAAQAPPVARLYLPLAAAAGTPLPTASPTRTPSPTPELPACARGVELIRNGGFEAALWPHWTREFWESERTDDYAADGDYSLALYPPREGVSVVQQRWDTPDWAVRGVLTFDWMATVALDDEPGKDVHFLWVNLWYYQEATPHYNVAAGVGGDDAGKAGVWRKAEIELTAHQTGLLAGGPSFMHINAWRNYQYTWGERVTRFYVDNVSFRVWCHP